MTPIEQWLMSMLSAASHIVLQFSVAVCLVWPVGLFVFVTALRAWRDLNKEN
jgi:hypothetical protein